MKRMIWRLRLALFMHRSPPGHQADPNFLFTFPPFVELHDGVPMVVVRPSGGDDTPQMQAAANRLLAIGGGTLQFTAGEFTARPSSVPWFYLDDSVNLDGQG